MSKRHHDGSRREQLDVHAVARALGGDVIGHGRVQAPGPGHSKKDRSLSIKLEPDAPGGFLVHSFAGDDPIACKDYIRHALGLPAFNLAKHRPRRSRSPSERASGLRHRPNDHRSVEQLSKARYLWSQTVPIAGSPAETYLRVARRYGGGLPSTLRYLKPKGRYPGALVAAFGLAQEEEPGVLSIERLEVAGIHLTRINADGSRKAGTDCDKIMIGSSAGSPIVLAPPNDLSALAIAEGIEDSLSVHEATGLGAWAAGAANRLPALAEAIPDHVECVTVIGDADPAGRRYARQLEKQLRKSGVEVIVVDGFEGPTTK